jgi:hypothetical protein
MADHLTKPNLVFQKLGVCTNGIHLLPVAKTDFKQKEDSGSPQNRSVWLRTCKLPKRYGGQAANEREKNFGILVAFLFEIFGFRLFKCWLRGS